MSKISEVSMNPVSDGEENFWIFPEDNPVSSVSSGGYRFTVQSKRSSGFNVAISLNARTYDLGHKKLKHFVRIPDRDYTIAYENAMPDQSLSRVPKFTLSCSGGKGSQTLCEVEVDASLDNPSNIEKILEEIDRLSLCTLPTDDQGQCHVVFEKEQDQSASTNYQQIASYLKQLRSQYKEEDPLEALSHFDQFNVKLNLARVLDFGVAEEV